MRLKAVVPLLLAPALAACWEAPTPLMPPAERDLVPLSGRYEKFGSTERETLDITRLPDRRYTVVRSENGAQVERLTASLDSADDLAPPGVGKDVRVYIVETVTASGTDATANYSLVMLDRSDAAVADFVHLKPACAKATKRIARADPGGGCRFTSYRDVRAATADLLAWLEDPRIQTQPDIYSRPKPRQ